MPRIPMGSAFFYVFKAGPAAASKESAEVRILGFRGRKTSGFFLRLREFHSRAKDGR